MLISLKEKGSRLCLKIPRNVGLGSPEPVRFQKIAVNPSCWDGIYGVRYQERACQSREDDPEKMGEVVQWVVLNCIATKPSFAAVISLLLTGQKVLIFQSFLHCSISGRGQQTHSVRGRAVNALGFKGHTVSVATTHPCRSSIKTTTDSKSTNECDLVLKKLFTKVVWV